MANEVLVLVVRDGSGNVKDLAELIDAGADKWAVRVDDGQAQTILEALRDRIGEVQTSPTANTLLARLKQIADNTDALEGYTDNLEVYVDGVEALATSIRDELASIDDKMPDEAGTWGYAGGASGTRNLTGSKRVIGITAAATESGATVTINGGDAIPVPTNFGLAIAPRGNLVDPSLVFTGTAAYFVEHLT